jgi:hypothetical protein
LTDWRIGRPSKFADWQTLAYLHSASLVAGRLVDSLDKFDRLTDWQIGKLAGWQIVRLANQQAGRLTECNAARLASWYLSGQQNGSRLTDSLADLLSRFDTIICSLADWKLIDRLEAY